MTVKLQKRLINVDEYHLMGEVGILKEKGIELIEGEIIKMSPTGSNHSACVSVLIDLLTEARLLSKLKKDIIIRVQDPIMLDDFSEPEPDIVIVKYLSDYYRQKLPQSKDVLLLIEVSDSTLGTDREIKAPLYAKASVPEYWIVNIEAQQIEVYYAPASGAYQQKKVFGINDELKAQFNTQISVKLKEVFG
ncbi:hypothetical protein BKI52_19975 [marine bacterium AO1-C]|nr:hypothetical protein BKI52_19975 [marine bacterium AO1-C]